MAFIDSSYFVGELNIPNTNKDYILQRLNLFINKREPELLQDILGYELYKAFSAGTASYDDDGSNSTIEQRWIDLIEGDEYTRYDRLHKWKGLLYERDGQPYSLIANYVYWHWTEDQTTQTVGLGEAAAKAENADRTSPAVKMVNAWNEMSEQICDLIHFLQANTTVYPEWKSGDAHKVLNKFGKTNTFGI